MSGVDLSSPHVTMCRLILRIDSDGQRLDRVHVQVGNLFGITHLVDLGASNFTDSLFIESVKQMNEDDD